MELERLCKRFNNVPSSIERAYVKDISKIIDDMMFEYDIRYKDTDHHVSKDILLRRFLSVFGKDEPVKICKGISQNGNKCCRRVHEDSDYCKTHKYLEFRERLDEKNQTKNNTLFFIENNTSTNLDVSNLKTQLIEDTFYYVDSSFVYDKSTLERVGYVEGNRYILTDDPFILCL
jgi:hypothetical protein